VGAVALATLVAIIFYNAASAAEELINRRVHG